ncbi:MAG TPA: hypothetical protein VFT08_04520, partial [Pyrinomonadaceae bacterium]|nr:hypothetical protein [Pyrinomonadaceae bacterium]
VIWSKGPTLGETDQLAVEGVLKDVLKVNEGIYRRKNSGGTCEPREQKIETQNGFTGMEFDLSNCLVPTRMRVYTKVIDDQRQMYIGFVAGEQDENATRFLKSFNFGSAKTRKR